MSPSIGRHDPSRRLLIDGKPLVDDHFSGIGHYTMSIVKALDGLLADDPSREVRLAVPASRLHRLDPLRLERIRPLRIPMTYLGFRRRIETGRLPRMDRLLGRATYFFPNYVRWPLAHSPSVTAVHDLSFDKLADSVDGPNAVFLRREVANSVARSDLITALTDTMADEIAEHYSVRRDRVKVVGCAADLAHFYRRSEDEVERVKADHGVYGDYVISVGNIEPRKNQVRLLDAFCACPGRSPTGPCWSSWVRGPGTRRRSTVASRQRSRTATWSSSCWVASPTPICRLSTAEPGHPPT